MIIMITMSMIMSIIITDISPPWWDFVMVGICRQVKTVNEDEDKMQVLLVESPSHRGYREPPLGDRLTLLRFIIIIPTFTMTRFIIIIPTFTMTTMRMIAYDEGDNLCSGRVGAWTMSTASSPLLL